MATKIIRHLTTPMTLYRLQLSQKVVLRQKFYQLNLGRKYYDYVKGQNNQYCPTIGDQYKGPNGLMLLPLGQQLKKRLQHFSGDAIYEIAQGISMPDRMVLIQQKNNYFSLETEQKIFAGQFCRSVEKFFKSQKSLSIKQLQELCQKLQEAK